jgi:hypothetical protein
MSGIFLAGRTHTLTGNVQGNLSSAHLFSLRASTRLQQELRGIMQLHYQDPRLVVPAVENYGALTLCIPAGLRQPVIGVASLATLHF